MPTKSSRAQINPKLFGKQSRAKINAEAKAEKDAAGISGRWKRVIVHKNGIAHEIPIPDIKALREALHLTQQAFAMRFRLQVRTVQQWEQRRALPDGPTRILLKAIERYPDMVEAAA